MMQFQSNAPFNSILSLQNQIIESIRFVFTDKIIKWDYRQLSLPFHEFSNKIFSLQSISYNTSRMNAYFNSLSWTNNIMDKEDIHEYTEDCRIMYCAMLILCLSYYSPLMARMNLIPDCESLLITFPEVSQTHVRDLETLRKFRNYMAIALTMIPSCTNKWLLIRACERLDGSNTIHRSGRGETPATKARMLIYASEVSAVKDLNTPFTIQCHGIFSSRNTLIAQFLPMESNQHIENSQFQNMNSNMNIPSQMEISIDTNQNNNLIMKMDIEDSIDNLMNDEEKILFEIDHEIFSNDWGVEFSPKLTNRKYSFDSHHCCQEQMELLLNE